MAAALEYVATQNLPIAVDGEVLVLAPGELIPNPEQWGRSLHANLEAGKIVVRTSLAAYSDAELLDEIAARGLQIAKTDTKGRSQAARSEA